MRSVSEIILVCLLMSVFACTFLFAGPVRHLQSELQAIQKELLHSDNIWLEKLRKHGEYNEILMSIQNVQKQLGTHSKNKIQTVVLEHILRDLKQQEKHLESYRGDLFGDLLKKSSHQNYFDILWFILVSRSFSKAFGDITNEFVIMQKKQESLKYALDLLDREIKVFVLLEARFLDHRYFQDISKENIKKKELQRAQETLRTNIDVYSKQVERVKQKVALWLINMPLFWVLIFLLGLIIQQLWVWIQIKNSKAKSVYKVNQRFHSFCDITFFGYIITIVYCLSITLPSGVSAFFHTLSRLQVVGGVAASVWFVFR